MEGAAGAATPSARSVSLSLPRSAPGNEWRTNTDGNGNAGDEGKGLHHGVDYHSVQMDGLRGMDEEMVQQTLHDLARQREEVTRAEIELRAQVIANSEMVKMKNSFSEQIKELQEQLRERDQKINEFERKLDDKEREIHAVRLDNEKAWAKEGLLREQSKELANFRREHDSIEAERALHIQQIHDLQDHIQEKDSQLLELQEQHKVDQENIHYKEEKLRDAQTWISGVQGMDVLQSSTHSLQAELRERTEQYNQLWLYCQRQIADMEVLHIQTVHQLQLELLHARQKSGQFSDESHISQTNSNDISQNVQMNGSHQADTAGSPVENAAASLQNGNSDILHSSVSSGNVLTPITHVAAVPITPQPLLSIPSYLSPGHITALHPYMVHQQGVMNSVPSNVPQSHLVQFPSMATMPSFQQCPSQQAVIEGQTEATQSEGNHPRLQANYGFEIAVNGLGHQRGYDAHITEGVELDSFISSTQAQALNSVDKDHLAGAQSQQRLVDFSSQFDQALRLHPLEAASDVEAHENTVISSSDVESESLYLTKDQSSSAANSSPTGTTLHFSENASNASDVVRMNPFAPNSENATNASDRVNPFAPNSGNASNTSDVVRVNPFAPNAQNDSLPAGNTSHASLLGEKELLSYMVRTVPVGGRIRISSTLPNKLGKMLAPLQWHDYQKTYGKLHEFVAGHPELFVIEGDYIQLREGAQGIVSASAAVAKVAAAAASSPYQSFLPSVAVTPMPQANRLKKVLSTEAKPVQTAAYTSSQSLATQTHSNGAVVLDGVMHGQSSVHNHPETGTISARFSLGNSLQPNGTFNGRTGVHFISKQKGRTIAAPSASRR